MPLIDDVAWLLFIAASLVLIVTPGKDIILVMSRSMNPKRVKLAFERRP
jgi:threonine/homoserine/homoserine lactone efflux protein